jgi:non-ribosomal peptide synthetase component F
MRPILFERCHGAPALAYLRAILETVAARARSAACRRIPLVSRASVARGSTRSRRERPCLPRACTSVRAAGGSPARRHRARARREAVSYGELEARANRLAVRLSALGVRPGERVGLCLERSIDAVVAMLATLKSGGAYVPLDPAYPQERLAFLIADSKPCVIVTRSELAPAPSSSTGATIFLEPRPMRSRARARSGRAAAQRPHELAYVIYTSGPPGGRRA